MKAYNPIETLAEALYSAVHNENYLPDIKYYHKTPQDHRDGKEGNIKYRRPRPDELEVYHFPQTWASTALGFGGIGGAAMTTAYTTVVISEDVHAAVFFGGKFAYTVMYINQVFYEDLKKHYMASVKEREKYHGSNSYTSMPEPPQN